MKSTYEACWGISDRYQAGREAKTTIFNQITFEANSLAHAKATATRKMKADPRMERYIKTIETSPSGETYESVPPRWTAWSSTKSQEMLNLITSKSTDQTFDGPGFRISRADPNAPPPPPGHYAWLQLYCIQVE